MTDAEVALFDLSAALEAVARTITHDAYFVSDDPGDVLRIRFKSSTLRGNLLLFIPVDTPHVDPDSEVRCVEKNATDDVAVAVSPSQALGFSPLIRHVTPRSAPTADPRIVRALHRLDATALISLRALGGFSSALYEKLRDLGPEAPINRFLAQNPGFAGWLKPDIAGRPFHKPAHWIDPNHSGFADSADPRSWIIDFVADLGTLRCQRHPPDRAAVAAIVDLLLAHPTAVTEAAMLRPETVLLLAATPEHVRPRHRTKLADAIRWADVAAGLTGAPGVQAEQIHHACYGRWGDHRKSLLTISDGRWGEDACLFRQAQCLLIDAEKPREWQTYRPTRNGITALIEARLVAIGSHNLDLHTYLSETRLLDADFKNGRAYDTEALRHSRLLPGRLRGLKTDALLKELGFDVSAMLALLNDDRDLDVDEIQRVILAKPYRFASRTIVPRDHHGLPQ